MNGVKTEKLVIFTATNWLVVIATTTLMHWLNAMQMTDTWHASKVKNNLTSSETVCPKVCICDVLTCDLYKVD